MLTDLKGISLAAMDPGAYYSARILAWRVFHNAGIYSNKNFPALKRLGYTPRRIVASVLDGSVTVGMVPFGANETLSALCRTKV